MGNGVQVDTKAMRDIATQLRKAAQELDGFKNLMDTGNHGAPSEFLFGEFVPDAYGRCRSAWGTQGQVIHDAMAAPTTGAADRIDAAAQVYENADHQSQWNINRTHRPIPD
jgi:hypothetical protein